MYEYDCRTVDATRALGRALGRLLQAGDLVVLTGPLGAGKTAFAQGIGAGLGVAGAVTSPTFVIARVHRPALAHSARPPLVHVDAYRLGSVLDPRAEIDDLDLDATMEDAVTVVEWGEGLVERLVDGYLEVRLDRRDDDSRTITLAGHGAGWIGRLDPIDLDPIDPAGGGSCT